MRFKIILIMICILAIMSMIAEAINYYELTLVYDDGNFSYDSLIVKPLLDGKELNNLIGGYVAEILSFDEEILNETFFGISLSLLYDDFNPDTGSSIGGGEITLKSSMILLKLPYYENSKEINIYDMDLNKKLSIDVSHFSKNISIKKELEPKKEITEEIKEVAVKKEVKKEKNYGLIIATIGIVIIMLLVIIVLLRKRKSQI